MKLPRQFSSLFKNLITNKYVLYLVAFLALTNVLGYMMLGQLQCVILFILIGYIATHFSKNMVIVLLSYNYHLRRKLVLIYFVSKMCCRHS